MFRFLMAGILFSLPGKDNSADGSPTTLDALAASLVDCAISVLQMRITLTPPAPTAGAFLFSV